jgi:hypothetical protein
MCSGRHVSCTREQVSVVAFANLFDAGLFEIGFASFAEITLDRNRAADIVAGQIYELDSHSPAGTKIHARGDMPNSIHSGH